MFADVRNVAEPQYYWWGAVIYLRQFLINICLVAFRSRYEIQAVGTNIPASFPAPTGLDVQPPVRACDAGSSYLHHLCEHVGPSRGTVRLRTQVR